ncbi:hypothetical protein [Leptospira noguchii]|uniref:Uncharacterized protein n=1 Tax=Leptospira noguchii str. 2007001578 TaxID=1049974 RepID=A0ABP2T890_9LEPT|nr:hypothetical protein [Leptospira noguchii]EMN00268.1 hypothetical protein LEP1GSC035_4657 [Leptospira noguchii str. 2007001578]
METQHNAFLWVALETQHNAFLWVALETQHNAFLWVALWGGNSVLQRICRNSDRFILRSVGGGYDRERCMSFPSFWVESNFYYKRSQKYLRIDILSKDKVFLR